jgi:3-oxoacyl-[acyl-carrier protein] reductase
MEGALTGRLLGRKAIVTGAASGIGAASARLFAAEGADVLAVDRPGSNLGEVASGAPLIVPLEADLADANSGNAVVAEAVSRFGGLDILYSNAGISASTFVENHSDEEWDRILNVNTSAAFRLSRAAIPHLKTSKAGRIIATASVMANFTDYGLGAYCASKAGVAGLMRALALELGKFSITANWIEPGAIRTGMTGALWDARPDVADIWAKKSVLRRLGAPEDIARVALFLASDDSGFVTGQGIAVDGGLTLRT